jgi:uncharacterized RDD family membrane protein YckC
MSQVTPLPPGMGQCMVTGKIVPEDELVTLHGQRVCAEGKAILLDRLQAGEAMPGEAEKPTVLRRFGCIFLDGLIIGVPFAVLNGVLTADHSPPSTLGIISLLSTVVYIIYFGQMHASRGQSVGKIAGKLLVVNDRDGSRISTATAYIRAIVYSGTGVLSGVALLMADRTFMSVATMIVVGWGLADVIFALVDTSKQRSLHDRIAGTRVIERE